jgi:hypothetical protein
MARKTMNKVLDYGKTNATVKRVLDSEKDTFMERLEREQIASLKKLGGKIWVGNIINPPKDISTAPIQKNILLEDLEFTFGQCLQTAIAKNSDYRGSNKDPYANFRNSTIAGVSVEQGIVVRMADKISRIGTLLQKEAKVKDEAIEDTLMDLINYTAILKSYLKNSKDEK